MRMTVTHHTTRENARRIIDQKIVELEGKYGHYASEIERRWTGDVLNFSFKAKGFQGKGSLEITDSEVIVDGKLPLIAKPFESRIRSTVEREGAELFPA
jgi:hypothetical protein